MRLKIYVIAIDLTPKQKRLLRGAVVVGAAIAAMGAGIAMAAIDTTWISTGQPVSSAQLKGDLDGLQAQITSLQNQISSGKLSRTVNGVSYSGGATVFCGTTPTQIVGNFSYGGAKQMCQASLDCDMSATAHMCTNEEMVRSAQLGLPIPAAPGWISNGTLYQGLYDNAGVYENLSSNDCLGWSPTVSGSYGGAVFSSGGSGSYYGNTLPCDETLYIFCCD